MKAYHKRKNYDHNGSYWYSNWAVMVLLLGNMDRYLGAWSKIFTVSMEVSALVTSIEEIYLYALLLQLYYLASLIQYGINTTKNTSSTKRNIKILEVDA